MARRIWSTAGEVGDEFHRRLDHPRLEQVRPAGLVVLRHALVEGVLRHCPNYCATLVAGACDWEELDNGACGNGRRG